MCIGVIIGCNIKKDSEFIMTQYHHLSWPEDRNPSSEILLEMMDMVTKAQMSAGSKPITVMCRCVRLC